MKRAFNKFNEIDRDKEKVYYHRKINHKEIKMNEIKPEKINIPKEKEVRIDLEHRSESDSGEKPKNKKYPSSKPFKMELMHSKMDSLAPTPTILKDKNLNPPQLHKIRKGSDTHENSVSTRSKSKITATSKLKLK